MTLTQVAAAISSSFTASRAVSASYATSASYEINYETSSSYADTASFVTASNVYGPFGSNSIISSSYALSASYAISSSNALSSSYAISASYTLTSVSASYAISSSNALSSSYAITASYTPTLQQVLNSGAGASNYGDIGSASIELTNFTNSRKLYLNSNSTPTIRMEDNANASNNLTIDLSTLTIDNIAYNWSDIVSNTFPYTGSAIISGSLNVTGSLNVSGSITGSLFGTASHALSAMTTGSSTGNTLTFTKGDGSTFNLYITPEGAFPVNYGLFNQTGSSTPVLGTTPSGSLLAGGVGTLSVPANGFAVGDAFTVTMFGNLTSNNGHGLEIVLSSNGTALVDTNTITMPGATDKGYKLDVSFTINKIGGTGVASLTSAGLFTFRTNSSGDVVTEIFSTVNNTTFDTTTGNTLDIRAIWTGGNGSDSIYSNLATLNKAY
jgi:hypothetical protein